jgi:hypothetical protein
MKGTKRFGNTCVDEKDEDLKNVLNYFRDIEYELDHGGSLKKYGSENDYFILLKDLRVSTN